jgi:DNA repair exonuclease SbcCD ATPase subunit
MYFIQFNEKDSFFISCKIKEQFLSHSFDLIYTTFEKGFKELQEARGEKIRFLNIVGSSQGRYFKIVEATRKDRDIYLKRIIKIKEDYEAYLKGLNEVTDEENNNLNQKTGFINLSEDKDNLLSLNNVCKHLNRRISI